MSSQPVAENYQLKWHSHLTNLNSSVATLYRNERFADVLLFTSNSECASGIPAHKIILSSCSHYFASIFEVNPTPPNAMVYIVLPPELSKRSIQILIQYMYSGEATVSNDILNEVLRGGEVLKIRGLWRNHQTADANASSTPQFQTTTTATTASSHPTSSVVKSTADRETSFRHPSPAPPHSHHHEASTKETVIGHHHHSSASVAPPPQIQLNSSEKHQDDQHSPHQPHPHHHHHPHHRVIETLSKESPVIVMVPRQTQLSSHQPPTRPMSPTLPLPLFKKEIINEPTTSPCTTNPSHYGSTSGGGLVSLQSMKKSLTPSIDSHHHSNNNKSGATLRCAAASSLVENGANERIRRYSDEQHILRPPSSDDFVATERFGLQSSSNLAQHQHHQHTNHRFSENLPPHLSGGNGSRQRRVNSCTDGTHESVIDNNPSNLPQRHERPSVARFTPRLVIEQKPSATHAPVKIPDALSFLTIKEEPLEWVEYESDGGGAGGGLSSAANAASADKSHIEVTVKPEVIYATEENITEDDEMDEIDEMVYSPLTCELCSETFTIPGDWVRHIEGHAEATQCVPKKRKRVGIELSSTADNIAALRCDLCSMYFVTPAEWVRHVQSTHTETELALSNNSTPPKRNQRSARAPDPAQPLEKDCSICKKSFPSYASMVIHKRTHTGERPFYCSLCNKGFNVKSNLLRHMRTLHNQLLHPANLNDFLDSASAVANDDDDE